MISAPFLMRLMIVSYFVALSLGITYGTDMSAISDSFLPADLSHYVMRALVLTLSGMVLFDIKRRAAALILSVFVFWSSYLAVFLGGSVGEFWLNLALIGALLYIGGLGTEEQSPAETADTEHEAIDRVAQRRYSPRQLSGGDLPYREDLDVVRDV